MRITGLISVLLLAFSVLLGFAQAKQPESVPDAWLDSLQANLWRMDSDSLGYSFNVLAIQHKLDKNGNIKSSDSSRMHMAFDDQGNRLIQELDETGAVKKSRIQNREEESEQSEEKEEEGDSGGRHRRQMSINPFSSFDPKTRGNFAFTPLTPDTKGHPRFSVKPLNDTPGFIGDFTVDTTLWVPLHVTGHPSEPPKHIKSLEMDMAFEPDINGA
ncbi:MAG: hypothetical protein V2A56_05360, partial [bacterium]